MQKRKSVETTSGTGANGNCPTAAEDRRDGEVANQQVERQPIHGDAVEKAVDRSSHEARTYLSNPRVKVARAVAVDHVAFEAELLDERDAGGPWRRRRWRTVGLVDVGADDRQADDSRIVAGPVRIVDVLAADAVPEVATPARTAPGS